MKLWQHNFTIATGVKLLTKGLCSESGLHSLPSRSSRCPRLITLNDKKYLFYQFICAQFALFSSLVWRNGYRINIWIYLATPEFQWHLSKPIILSLEVNSMALDFKPWNTQINPRCEIFVFFSTHSIPSK